jgi:hypothetical protein
VRRKLFAVTKELAACVVMDARFHREDGSKVLRNFGERTSGHASHCRIRLGQL